jgi:hypothetical protein
VKDPVSGKRARDANPRVSRRERQQAARHRRSGGGSGRIALLVAVLALVLVVLFIVPKGPGKKVEPLPRASLVTSTPINTTDPTSGKPIAPGLTSTYKGYTIGHCCAQSKTDWEVLGVERKDSYVRGFLR